MSEAVKVIAKCRPMNRREKELKCKQVLEVVPDTGQCSIRNGKDRDAPPKTFTFDGAYGPDSSNEQVYLDIAFPLVEGVTEGYNGTVFAYGQTGCGKTFTMQGVEDPEPQRGLIPRAFEHIFDTVAVAERTKYLIHASFLEIYNEEVRDLLGEDAKARLELRERPDGQVFVKDLSLHAVARVRDCEVVMNRGWKNRATGATLMNAVSSRSHSIFTIHLERCDEPADSQSKSKIRASKLNLVDLAGSERQSKTGSTGERLKEATKINLSLSALGNVISALVDGHSVHIPYRDSKLTRLLQDSLGGNTKTLMIACLSPADNNYEESLSTLRYANRAKNIKNKPHINEDPKDALIRQYLDEISRLKEMLEKTSTPPQLQQPEFVPPPTPAPQIVEKIVHVPVPDEDEMRLRVRKIADEYEKKIQKMAADVAEARADRDRTAVDVDRLRAESEAKQRQLQAEFVANAEAERSRLTAEFDSEMERVQGELQSTRSSREAVRTEMDSLRHQYESAMSAVENAVPPELLNEERERLRLEYESNMKTMREELESVKSSRTHVETEMEKLRVDYRAKLDTAQSTILVASVSTSTAPLTIVSEQQLRQQNLTDEMKIVSDRLHHQEERRTVDFGTQNSNQNVMVSQSTDFSLDVVSSVQSKLVTDSLGKYSTDGKLNTKPDVILVDRMATHSTPIESTESSLGVVSAVQSKLVVNSLSKYSTDSKLTSRPEVGLVDSMATQSSAIDGEKLHHEATSGYETVRAKLNSELDELRNSKENLARVVNWIKMAYHEEVREALDSVPGDMTEDSKQEIRDKYERKMDHVKDDLRVLKSRRNIATQELADQETAWSAFKSERQKIDADAAAGRLERNMVGEFVKAASEKYLDDYRRLETAAAAGREKEQTRIINEGFQRDERRVFQDVETGRLTQTQADEQLARLLQEKSANLNAARDQTRRLIDLAASEVENLEPKNANTKREPTDDSDIHRLKPDAVAMRLKTLEDSLVGGGYTRSASSLGREPEHRRRIIREKLRQEKLHAEDTEKRLHEAVEGAAAVEASDIAAAFYDAFASTSDELTTKTRALQQLLSDKDSLVREIADLQAEFAFDRIDFMDTIRKQEKELRWYQGVVDNILPAVRRDSNYADLERARVLSAWDDLNCRWILPKLAFDRKRLCLPPASLSGQSRTTSMSPSGLSISGDADYEMRCESRLLEKLQESELRDPAANYFRAIKSAGSGSALGMRSEVAGARSNDSLVREPAAAVAVSPLLRRPRQL